MRLYIHFRIFLLLFLANCSVKQSAQDTLFVALDSQSQTLDPRKAVSANDMRLIGLIFNSFVKHGNQGELESDLALHWKLKGLTWIFKLKPNLKFSNGRLVSKEDILFSFEEFRKKRSPFYSAFKNIKSVEVLNKKNTNDLQFTVKIHLKAFQAPFISSDLPVLKILPKQEILTAQQNFNKYPIGTGDWTVIKNDFRQILLKRNTPTALYQTCLKPSCYLDKTCECKKGNPKNTLKNEKQKSTQAFSDLKQAPALEKARLNKQENKSNIKYISFNIIRDSLTRAQKMLSKEIDIAPSVIALDKISQFKKQSQNFKILTSMGFSTTYLLINLKNNFLKNKKLRKALSLAANTEEIIKYKLYGYAAPAVSFISPNSYFFNKNLPPPEFNLKKAKDIINELNLKDLQLKLNCSNNSSTVSKARALASQISKTGLKISIDTSEWGAFYKDITRGAFDLALMRWVGVVDPDIYRIAFHSANQAPKGRNRSFYQNKNLDKMLEQGFKERDKKIRKQIYNKAQALIAAEFVVIPLWHDQEISVIQTSIENYHIRANGDFLSLPFVIKK